MSGKWESVRDPDDRRRVDHYAYMSGGVELARVRRGPYEGVWQALVRQADGRYSGSDVLEPFDTHQAARMAVLTHLRHRGVPTKSNVSYVIRSKPAHLPVDGHGWLDRYTAADDRTALQRVTALRATFPKEKWRVEKEIVTREITDL